ncbi:hypothetical protein J5X84_02305 [Streptosporangiaceae bacterium NEAU-GS5]|nr:hypothetical protein [Streptosporangiaceae bacterium NEAU-GS5]
MNPADAEAALRTARLDVERIVTRLVTTAYGEQAVSLRPIFPGAASRHQVADPLPGLWAAKRICSMAKAEVRRFARLAREAGHTWPQIGAALQIRDADYHAPGEAAFEYVAERIYDTPSFSWRCTAEGCGRLIRDFGPLPSFTAEDTEGGHAPGCTGHGGLAAHARRRGLNP